MEIIFVDMRWGVRDENTLEHRTWIECARELDRCMEESSGVFFLSLQSYKCVCRLFLNMNPLALLHEAIFDDYLLLP